MSGLGASPVKLDFSSVTAFLEKRWGKLFLGLVLVLASLTVYSPVHRYSFFNVDDRLYVYENAHVLGPLNWSTIKWAFTHTFVLNYDPLTFLAHKLDVKLFGLDPAGHHEVNVVLHALNAVLLFWVLKRSTGFTGRSFMVAALFAVHPINVENVAWVSELKTILSTAFFLLALGAYRWYAAKPMLRRMGVVAFLYGLGLLAKPQVISLPFVLLLWDYWPLRRMFAADPNASRGTCVAEIASPRSLPALLKEKVPLFAIAAADAVITMFAEHKASPEDWPYTFSIRLGNAILSYVRYLGKAFWPFHLAYLYPHPGYSLRWAQVWAALFLLITVTVLVIARRRQRYLAVGWFWFLGTMVPVIGLVQIDAPALADRWAYIGFVGLFLMICWAVAEWVEQRHWPKLVLPVANLAALLLLAGITHRQMRYWSDSLTLWSHTLEVTHRNWIAETNLGALLQQRGQTEEALAHFYRAAEEEPGNTDVNLNVAIVEHQRGNLRQAIPYYEKALANSQDDRTNEQIWSNMGRAYSALGNEARARECFAAASRLHQLSPPPPRQVINWQGEWWRDLLALIREQIHSWTSRLTPARR
jgi:tetratricopeptide (TPR) repeat protein